MNQFSEVIGSFLRNGQFPLEANYVFATEEELIQFYSEPENQAIVHQGWFKVVGEGEDQALYWVVKENDELKFSKLIEKIDIETLYKDLEDLQDKLNQEIEDRQNSDNEIWGSTIIEELDNLSQLLTAVQQLKINVQDLTNKTNSIIGSEEDWKTYLETLDYPNITALSEALNKFLNTVDESDDKINTLPELLSFLEGYTDKDILKGLLQELLDSIMGDPIPSEEFRTLRGIEDFVRLLKSQSENTDANLQSELDRTLIGVGLSGDGSYNSDKETHYLKDATSIMNALKILDGAIHDNSINVSSKVGNQIIIEEDGVYHSVDLECTEGILYLRVNGNLLRTIPIGVSSLVEDTYYDPDIESIVIIFKLLSGESLRIRIPVGSLIREWEIDNSGPSKVVELTKEDSIGPGADKLSADVRLSNDRYNILKKDGNTLLVDGRADNIIYDGDATVKSKLDSLQATIYTQTDLLESLSKDLLTEISNRESSDQDLQNKIDSIDTKATTNELNIADLQLTTNLLEKDLAQEISNRKASEQDVNNQIAELNDRISNNETNISDLQSQDIVKWNSTGDNKAIYLEKEDSISAKFENSDTRTPILQVLEDDTHVGSRHFKTIIDSTTRPEVCENGNILLIAYLSDISSTIVDRISLLEDSVNKLDNRLLYIEKIINDFIWNI